MNTRKATVKTLTAVLALAGFIAGAPAQAAEPSAGASQYQSVSPLGFVIPAPGSQGAVASARSDTFARTKGVSPLGFEIPAPSPAGAQGPVRSDNLALESTRHKGVSPLGFEIPGS